MLIILLKISYRTRFIQQNILSAPYVKLNTSTLFYFKLYKSIMAYLKLNRIFILVINTKFGEYLLNPSS